MKLSGCTPGVSVADKRGDVAAMAWTGGMDRHTLRPDIPGQRPDLWEFHDAVLGGRLSVTEKTRGVSDVHSSAVDMHRFMRRTKVLYNQILMTL